MSNTTLYALIILFVLISLGLAGFVWSLFHNINVKKNIRQEALDAHAASAQKHKHYLIDSIRIIARSIVDGQCPMIEGCIRLKVMIDNYAPQLHQQPELQVVELIYVKTSHIPTLEAWKNLPAHERNSFQTEMDHLESEHAVSIKEAARFLKEYPFEQRAH